MRATAMRIGVVAAALLLINLCGCHCAQYRTAVGDAAPTDSADLVMQISDAPYVSAAAGYRAIYALAEGTSFDGDFVKLAAALETAEVVPTRWQYTADRCLDRAAVAFMICRACQIRTGVNWQLTGLGRYAWRELQYKGIAGPGSEMKLITGGEFVGLLTRTEDYLRTRERRGLTNVEFQPPAAD